MAAILFDLDGTLLHFPREYREVLANTFRAVAGEVRDDWLDTSDEAFFDAFHACDPDPYRRALEAVGTPSDQTAFVETLFEEEMAMCEPASDVHAALERLSEDYALGVLTNGVPEWQRHKLREHDLARYFEAVVVSDEVGAYKPDPAPFRAAERSLPAETYAMVGDNDADVDGARNAGWTPYRYRGEGFGDLPDALVDV